MMGLAEIRRYCDLTKEAYSSAEIERSQIGLASFVKSYQASLTLSTRVPELKKQPKISRM